MIVAIAILDTREILETEDAMIVTETETVIGIEIMIEAGMIAAEILAPPTIVIGILEEINAISL